MAIQKWASDCSLATSTQIVSLAWPFLSTSISLKAKTRLFHIPSQWSARCSWVTQSCPTLCDPMDCSTSGFPVHQLPELAQTHVLSSRWCHSTISSSVVPFSSCLQSFPASGSFQMSPFLPSGGQSTGASASAISPSKESGGRISFRIDWLFSLLSKRLSRVFSNTQFKSINSLALSFLHDPTLTSIPDYLTLICTESTNTKAEVLKIFELNFLQKEYPQLKKKIFPQVFTQHKKAY